MDNYYEKFIIVISNNMSKTDWITKVTERNKEKCPEKGSRYYEGNTERLQKMTRDQYRGLSKKEKKGNMQEMDIRRRQTKNRT